MPATSFGRMARRRCLNLMVLNSTPGASPEPNPVAGTACSYRHFRLTFVGIRLRIFPPWLTDSDLLLRYCPYGQYLENAMAQHDTGYKLLFAHKEMVRDLLLGFIKESWIGELDLDSLEKVSESFVSDDLRSRHNDVIWRVRWRQQWVYLYLMLEFQSTVDYYMAVRLLSYIGLLYQDLIRRREVAEDKSLPLVLPIVLYNGRRRWRAPTALRQLSVAMPRLCSPPGPSCSLVRVARGAVLHAV